MYKSLAILILLLATASSAFAKAPPASENPSKHMAKINASSEKFYSTSYSVSGTDVDMGLVYALVKAPAAHVNQLLRDYGNYRHFLPFFRKSKVLSQTGTTAKLRMRAKIVNGTVNIKATTRVTETKGAHNSTQFKVKLLHGNVDRLDAILTVYPKSEKTCIVRCELLIDPDMWLVSDSTLTEYNQVNSRRTMRSLRKRLKKVPYQKEPATPPPEKAKEEAPAPDAK